MHWIPTRWILLAGSGAPAALLLLGCGWPAAEPAAPVALEWVREAGCRVAAVSPAGANRAGFTPMATPGLSFTNMLPEHRHLTNQIYLNGCGVAAADVDGDGWCDLFFSGFSGRSALYRNRGNWFFEEITREAGLELRGLDAAGAVFADVDGDGDADLLVSSYGQGTRCYVNDGRGRFGAGAVLNPGQCGSSLALADLEGDGDLDLYIAHYRTTTIRDQPHLRLSVKSVEGEPRVIAVNGRPLTHPEWTNRFTFRYQTLPGGGASVFHDELGEADAIHLNGGKGDWIPLPFPAAFADAEGRPLEQPPFDWGLSVMLRDLNGDGAPDIYVCNDFSTPDRIWINSGVGRFRALPAAALRQTSLSTMSMDVADINRDGHFDIFTADMLSQSHWRRLVQKNEPNPHMHLFVDVRERPQFPRNMLHLNRGDGTFAEIAQLAGLEASEWTWTPAFLDVDLDGYEDLLVVNGFERDYMNMDANREIGEARMRGGRNMPALDQLRLNRTYPRLQTPNLAFRNLGDLRFRDQSDAWGFALPVIAQGMCLADLDNDGDPDVVMNVLNGAAVVLRNDTDAPRVAVRLRGHPPNTRGIGARITLRGGPVPRQTQELICGGRYLSSDDALRVFAAGPAPAALELEVVWRSGRRSLITGVQPNRVYEVDEAAAQFSPVIGPVAPESHRAQFEDVSARLGHVDTPGTFDDLRRQPLLTKSLHQLGPGLAWLDVDGDDWEDLIIAGHSGVPAIYRNGAERFQPIPVPAEPTAGGQPQTAVVGWRRAGEPPVLLAGDTGYEKDPAGGGESRITAWDPATGRRTAEVMTGPAAAGPLAMADTDGDGTLELFVGGRCVPGRWPEPAGSGIFRQAGGGWEPDPVNTPRFERIGLVSGAVFSDIDGDGDPDLALACEWGPVRIFRNAGGVFTEATIELGFDRWLGWWNGVAAGDFDGDGRLDLAASNWGRNTPYERFRFRPLRLYYGDFNGDGSVGIIDSYFDPELGGYVPALSLWSMVTALPWLQLAFETYEAFGRATVPEILGDRLERARTLEANWLDSTVFLNRGDHFTAHPLPVEAQWAPAFALCVADFNGDAREDLFLSQNFFGVRPEFSRHDAGRGLLLHGDGQGGFAPVPGHLSGLQIYGEQRGAATCDFDRDGRTDLAVTQAGGETKLFRNVSAPAGIRVRLRGPEGNPQAIGAVLRVKTGDRFGPAREVHAGEGYWSQASAVQVLTATRPTELYVRWPGGGTTNLPLPQPAPITLELAMPAR